MNNIVCVQLILWTLYKIFNPLLFVCLFRKREEEKKREVLNNPVKMKMIKELVCSCLNAPGKE